MGHRVELQQDEQHNVLAACNSCAFEQTIINSGSETFGRALEIAKQHEGRRSR